MIDHAPDPVAAEAALESLRLAKWGLYILNESRQVVPVIERDATHVPSSSDKEFSEGVLKWGEWMHSHDKLLVVAHDELRGAVVSTVFIGINMTPFAGPPELFETARFTRAGGVSIIDRYATWADAEAGHRAYMQQQREGDDG